MPLIYDGKTYRNLEEQVRKNQKDISYIQKIQTLLNQFGIHVLGIKDDASQLPASSSEFGNAYAVGTQAPYEYYIWTDLDPEPGWMNIGVFPAPSTVEGPAGPSGTSVTAATIVDGYLVLTLTDASGNNTQITVGYVKGDTGSQGPRGLQGLQGIQGEQGPRGYTGEQGPRGYTGFALDIIALLSDVSDLPDPDTGDRHDAYVVQNGDDYELYGKVEEDGDNFAWENFGLIAFSTNYVTAAQLQVALDNLGELFVDDVNVDGNILQFLNNYSGNEVNEITFAKINGQNIIGIGTNFLLTTTTEFESFKSALILGTFVVARATTAKDIEPISEDSGSTQETPFIYQAAGTENNTTETPVSPTARQLEKQGNTVVVNQLAKELNSTNYTSTNANISYSEGVATMIPTAIGGRLYNTYTLKMLARHKYIYMISLKLTTATSLVRIDISNSYLKAAQANTNWQVVATIADNITEDTNAYLRVVDARSSDWDAIQIKDIRCIDLTQWFGSNDNIPAHLLSHPETFGNYYQGSLAYNIGTLTDCNGRYLVCGQSRNLWDEEVIDSGYILDDGTVFSGYGTRIASKNFIRVVPNTQYAIRTAYNVSGYGIRVAWYDKDKSLILVNNFYTVITGNYTVGLVQAPSNAIYMKFCTNNIGYASSTYKNDITLSEYFTTGTDYDQYYPYVVPKTYDTGTEVLKSAGNVKDTKAPDGTITRRVDSVDLGSLNWSYDGTSHLFSASLPLGKTTTNLLCSLYTPYELSGSGNDPDKCMFVFQTTLYITNNDYNNSATFKTAMSGVYLEYELATPTTESGTPFTDVIEVNDYGFMAWLDTSENYVITPQGCKIFYPAQYVQFIDDGVTYTNGDFTVLAKKTDLLPKLPNTSADGTYVLKAVKSGSTINYTWVLE